MITFVTLPVLLVLHLSVIGVILSRHQSKWGWGIRSYFSPSFDETAGTLLAYVQLTPIWLQAVLAGLGLLLIVLNTVSDGIFDQNGGCTNPLTKITIASVIATPMYQFVFVLLSCLVFGVIVLITELLKQSYQMARAERVHQCLMKLASHSEPHRLLLQWRDNSQGISRGQEGLPASTPRNILSLLLHIPLLLVVSLPAGGYVLSKK